MGTDNDTSSRPRKKSMAFFATAQEATDFLVMGSTWESRMKHELNMVAATPVTETQLQVAAMRVIFDNFNIPYRVVRGADNDDIPGTIKIKDDSGPVRAAYNTATQHVGNLLASANNVMMDGTTAVGLAIAQVDVPGVPPAASPVAVSGETTAQKVQKIQQALEHTHIELEPRVNATLMAQLPLSDNQDD